jgi:hypothetical protein
MAAAHEEIGRIRNQPERPLLESEMALVHWPPGKFGGLSLVCLFVNRFVFAFAYRDDHHNNLGIPDFINKAISRAAEFDFVAIWVPEQF